MGSSLVLHLRTKGLRSTLKKVANKAGALVRNSSVKKHSKLEWEAFYQAFELRFRGRPEDLTERLRDRYAGLLQNHFQSSGAGVQRAIDLGCGHGEFLQVLSECGFWGLGIDFSTQAIETTRAKGLEAISSDTLRYLKRVPTGTISLVSCLHMIEHCDPEYNFFLVREVKRCLKPGGLLILETPSILSLWAGHRQFYLDPTHEKPVHPDYLRFMCQYHGFRETEIREFGDVEHPVRGHLDPGDQEALKRWDKWLFGPMDLCCLARN